MAIKRIGYASILLLAYSLLIASWSGARTAPEVLVDLILTLTRFGGSLSQQTLWIQILVLFVCFVVGAPLFIWQIQTREYHRWASISLLVAGTAGFIQTLLLFSQIARLSALLICSLGFLGLAIAGFKESFVRTPKREQARDRMSDSWEGTLHEAHEKKLPVSILSGYSDKPFTPEITRKLINELRSNDQVMIVTDGLYILLWDTSLQNAITASQKTFSFLQENGYSGLHFGIVNYPQDGEHIAELLDKADFTLQICRQKSDCLTVTYREIVFPSDIAALFPVIDAHITEFMVRLINIWEEAQESGQPLSAILFDTKTIKNHEEDFIKRLSEWLRGKDQVGILTEGRVLALLFNTDHTGCMKLIHKLQEQWLNNDTDFNTVSISPFSPINIEGTFKEFIEGLLTIRSH